MRQEHIAAARLLVDRDMLLEELPKQIITCEVGVAFGGFSRRIVDIVQPRRHVMIDSWNMPGRYDHEARAEVERVFAAELADECAMIIPTDSVAGLLLLPANSIDFIYLDSDHSYETTRKELLIARDKLAPGGIIAGHDYKDGVFMPGERKFHKFGVIQAVNEFMAETGFRLKYLTLEQDQPHSFALQMEA